MSASGSPVSSISPSIIFSSSTTSSSPPATSPSSVTSPPITSSPSLITSPSPANELKLLNRKFQDSCYAHAKELNRIAQLIDPSAEPICLGQAHRAAGIFVYTRDEKLMLGVATPKEKKDSKILP